jgi:hypothetical protein
MELFEELQKGFNNTKNIITVNTVNEKIPRILVSENFHQFGFKSSQVHPKKLLKVNINNDIYYIVEGYVTHKREIKTTIIPAKKFLFVTTKKEEFVSDEQNIIKILEEIKESRKITYKLDFDEKANSKCYYFWMPEYLIISGTSYQEIDHKQFEKLRRGYLNHKHNCKKQMLKKKINDIETLD